MNKHLPIITVSIIFTFIFSTQCVHAQYVDNKFVSFYADSLAYYKLAIDSMVRQESLERQQNGTNIENKYFRLFTPLVYYPDVTGNIVNLSKESNIVDESLMNIYINRPELVQYTSSGFRKYQKPKKETDEVKPQRLELAKQVKQESEKIDDIPTEPIEMVVTRPDFWTFSGDYYLQFLQNYVSDNWYKSGSNSYSMLGTVTLQYNYNNKQRVKWDNKLELRLGLQTTEADTLNKFKTSDDLIRYTSRLGLQAYNKWYYTLQVIAQTQFARGLKNNDNYVYSDFLSPFNLNVSAGMDYSVQTKNKKLIGTIHVAPLAFNFKYVDRRYLASSFGIQNGHRTLEDFGSQYTIDLTWSPVSNFKWKTRLYGYTTYHKYEMEWENTLTFQFNKYISTCLYLYPRFDDSTSRDDDNGYFQFKEYFSFGFSYSM